MPEMTETQTPGRKPKKKKNKESHNAVERHRKEKINAGINRIGSLLPCSQALKQSKNMILDEAFRYITELKKQNDAMLLEGGDKGQAEEIRRLRCQLEELRKESAHYIELLKAHDINFLDDPTIHWKGKQRNAKVAKVTPTHQLPKGIIVYSNGNVLCPAGKEIGTTLDPAKQPPEAVIGQPLSEVSIGARLNGALLQVNSAPSSAPALVPRATVTPSDTAPSLRLVEQHVVEAPAAVAPTLPPSVSYITLQIPAATANLPQPGPPMLAVAAGKTSLLPAQSVIPSNPALPQTVCTSRPLVPEVGSVLAQDTTIRTAPYTTVPNSSTLLRPGAAGSTQTTWTTLQLAGNTVQPVCQTMPTSEVSASGQTIQQLTVCPVNTKPSVHPIQIHMPPQVPIQQAPITAHIQAPSLQRTPQLQPAILTQAQAAPVLAAQPQCAVLPQSAVVPQQAVLAHPAVVSQHQPAVLQPAAVVPHPQAGLIPQPQSAILPQPQSVTQSTLLPQPQATVLPLLQTMQVLQVNPTGAAASGVTAQQGTNNPSVVILQQGNTCPAQSMVREEITNQTPCQHIVIIQAPNQTVPVPAPQNPQVGMVSAPVPTMVPAVPSQIAATTGSNVTSTTCLQTVGGKQLVHILPRPIQPQTAQPLQPSQVSSSPSVPTTPQTITVNGQVFALQPMKTSDKSGSQGGQSTLQLVQPTTSEEPTTNVALNTLGALSSLNQSISQGLPITISSQSSTLLPCTPPTVVQQQQKEPPLPTAVPAPPPALPLRQLQVPSLNQGKPGPVVSPAKTPVRKPRMPITAKKTSAKALKPTRKKETKTLQPSTTIPAKPVSTMGEVQTTPATAAQVVMSPTLKITEPSKVNTTASKAIICSEATTQSKNSLTCTEVTSKTTPSCSSSSGLAISSEVLPRSVTSVSSSTSVVPQSMSMVVVSTAEAKADISRVTTSTSVAIVPADSIALAKLAVSTTIANQAKVPTPVCNNPALNKPTVPQRDPSATSSSLSTAHTAVATTAVSPSQYIFTTAASQVNSVSVVETLPAVMAQTSSVCRPLMANAQDCQPPSTQPQMQPQAQSKSLVSVSTTVPLSSAEVSYSNSPLPASVTPEVRKRVAVSRALTQQTDLNVPSLSPAHPVGVKPPHGTGREREFRKENLPETAVKEGPVAASKKDYALSQQVYTNLDAGTMEQPLTSSRQTDSPMSAGASGGRGFSVASMLPQGHGISASSNSFGTFTFTTEQAEILALAMLEQDSTSRRVGACSGDNPTSSNPPTATWEPPKTPPAPTSKERGSAGQQTKAAKPMEAVVTKPLTQVAIRGQAGESGVSGAVAARHPQNIPYSQAQSQAHTQVQSQNPPQVAAVGSLSVNNLIRPSSTQHPYPSSPSLASQQGSVPSPVNTTPLISQPSNPSLPPCSGTAQLNEYTPLKSALMRVQALGERHVKNVSKRQAQEEVMLPSGKRPKACPPSATNVGRMEVKAPDHSQMMVGQLPPSSSSVMTRINPDGVGTLFSTNSFMSTVLRPTEGHCPPQGPTEQSQSGVLHLPQGHSQHAAPQAGQHLGGNPYMKQQQQEQQRHHLYQLQHHLTQADPTQLHTLHQRALQQQDQQHVQKKRGLVRGNQTGSPAGLPQKPHHMEKTGVQQHPHQQQQQQQQQQTQHQQQHSQQQQSHQQSQQSHPQSQQSHPQSQQSHQQSQQSHQQSQQSHQQSQQSHQQSQQSHQQPQQSHQQSQQQHQQQQTQHQQSHQQQHQQQAQQQHQQTQAQHQHSQQQLQQSSHSRHQQHLQQIQQQHFGGRHQDKSCEAQASGPRGHHGNHLAQQEHLKSGQDHSAMQRLMSSRNLEQQLIAQPSNPVSRPSELACAPSRQERHRVSSYSAEALIGKSSSTGEQQQQRMGLHLQGGRGAAQEQPDLRGYLDGSRGKGNIGHNPQNRLPPQEHPGSADVQRVSECPPFKAMGGGGHQLGGFEVQAPRGGDLGSKSVPPSQRGAQGQQQQQQGGFRMGVGPPGDGRARGGYSGTHPGPQGVQIGAGLPREQEGCQQSFMQSLLSPHLPEQTNHQRSVQCCPPVSMEYSCVPGSSAVDMQAKASSPSVPQTQKAPAMRLAEGNKGHIPQVSGNMHGGPGVRAGLPHPPTPHSSSEPGRPSAPSRPPTAVSQRARHIAQDNQPAKLRPGDRPRSGTLRPGNPFEPEGHLPLPSGGGVLLGRPQSGGEARRSSIVRFMADTGQVAGDNNLVPDQHLAQNFGFPFIAEGGMNPPPPINANSTFIPPVSQPNTSRTPALLPVEPQNTLPSFYPSYSPAAHPSLPSDIPLQYFSNQMFTSPGADKGSGAPLNNRFGSILSPPRPVGFAQASFPLLPDMPPMPITNSSGITPHLSNFSLTSLFPEIATAMPTDGSAMPMSPLLSLANTSSADSGKQPNRPAHNISHILGHDGSSAV